MFNGHVHTTEMFDVDEVKYLMLGGGGAEQDPKSDELAGTYVQAAWQRTFDVIFVRRE